MTFWSSPSSSWPWDAPRLEDVYDEATLVALDTGVEPERDAPGPQDGGVPVAAASGWRGSLAGGAVLAGIALGLKEVFDPEPDGGAVIEVLPDPGLQAVDGITLFFVPDDPQATVAVVRRRLAGSRHPR